MLSLLVARTYEEGLPPETGIPGFWDSAVDSCHGRVSGINKICIS